MKFTITYQTALRWHRKCEELLDIFRTDTSLTMEIEWALIKNYQALSQVVEQYNNEFMVLQNQIDVTSDEGKTQVALLQSNKVRIDLIRLNHHILRGLKGVSLEVMALFDFMIT